MSDEILMSMPEICALGQAAVSSSRQYIIVIRLGVQCSFYWGRVDPGWRLILQLAAIVPEGLPDAGACLRVLLDDIWHTVYTVCTGEIL